MYRRFVCLVACAAVIALPRSASASPITYDIIPTDLTNPPGFELSGSITTDGTIGTLGRFDVLSWSVSVQQTVAPFANYSDSGNTSSEIVIGTITATPSDLSIPFVPLSDGVKWPTGTTYGGALVLGIANQGSTMTVQFQSTLGTLSDDSSGWLPSIDLLGPVNFEDDWGVENAITADSPFVFATVPEPSTTILAILAATGTTLAAIRRRR